MEQKTVYLHLIAHVNKNIVKNRDKYFSAETTFLTTKFFFFLLNKRSLAMCFCLTS